jgi:hypothetical protein
MPCSIFEMIVEFPTMLHLQAMAVYVVGINVQSIFRVSHVQGRRRSSSNEPPCDATKHQLSDASESDKKCFHVFVPNVELIRSKEGADRAPHETCLTKESDPAIGSAQQRQADFA